MQTELAKKLGIEFPIFAFTHCRDVVVAVSKAGGFGVLGAVGFTPEQLETELTWIDENIGDLPYGVDIVIPGKYEGMGEDDATKLEQELKDLIPEQHRKFANELLESHGVPEIPDAEKMQELLGWTEATAGPQVQVALSHPKVKLLANALGTPPPDVIEEIHASGRLVAALCGAASQAVRHANAGVDIVIAQGTEGGGHTGDVGSMVLWPEVIDALGDTPMLAAGGIGTSTLRLAPALGASRVIAVVSTEDKAEVARANGATDVVLADGFKDAVAELTGGRGVDIVMDPVGGDRFTDSLRSLAPAGRLLVVGFTGGEIPTVKVNRLLLNNIDVVGVGWGAWTLGHPGSLSEQWDGLAALLNALKAGLPLKWAIFVAAHLMGSWLAGLLIFFAMEQADVADMTEAVSIGLGSYAGARLMDKWSEFLIRKVAPG